MALVEESYVNFVEHSENLLSNLHNLYLTNMFVDLCLICHGNEIYAHKVILAAASPFLMRKIQDFGEFQTRINLDPEITGMDISFDDVKLLIDFIYKGTVQVPLDRLSIFLNIGTLFQISGLYKEHPSLEDHFVQIKSNNINDFFNSPLIHLDSYGFETINDDSSSNDVQPQVVNTSFSYEGGDLTADKFGDNSVKLDKYYPTVLTNESLNDLCVDTTRMDAYDFLTSKNIVDLCSDSNDPKLAPDINMSTNNATFTEDIMSLTTDTPFLFTSESGIHNYVEVFSGNNNNNSENNKELFETRGTYISSPGNSDPDVLFSSLEVHHETYLNPVTVESSTFSSSSQLNLPDVTCINDTKILSPPLPERQVRLKVKDSIGGVSLQDTSQGDKHAVKDFDESSNLTKEIHIVHPPTTNTEKPVVSQPEGVVGHVPAGEEDGIHICPQCLKCFNSSTGLNTHLYEEHKIGTMHKCILCSFKSLTENALVEHGKEHLDAADFQCCVCSKFLKTRSTLKNHLASHAADNWFKCDLCPAHYSQKYNLMKHLASEHRLDTKGEPIKESLHCPQCSYTTWAPHKLKNHETRCHSKDKPFRCSQCSYSATEKTTLAKHLRIHTQERPYMCDLCGLSFVTDSSLKRHSRGHAQEKPYECKECGQKYADNKRLRDHYLKHKSIKPFKCDFCPYSCRRKDNLMSHVKRNHKMIKDNDESQLLSS